MPTIRRPAAVTLFAALTVVPSVRAGSTFAEEGLGSPSTDRSPLIEAATPQPYRPADPILFTSRDDADDPKVVPLPPAFYPGLGLLVLICLKARRA